MQPASTNRIELSALPPLAAPIFDILQAAGARAFCLFGGALRDADHNSRWCDTRPIKDYDIRIWLEASGPDEETLVQNIATGLQATVRVVPSPGTGRSRYCFDFAGSEVDISIRQAPSQYAGCVIPIEAVALERAADSDIGISSVAMDPSMQAWARPEYLHDQSARTLTVFDIPDALRKAAYLTRMRAKFPGHAVQHPGTHTGLILA
jgi:hypothetical protein